LAKNNCNTGENRPLLKKPVFPKVDDGLPTLTKPKFEDGLPRLKSVILDKERMVASMLNAKVDSS
jgi:hypothetical protein